MKTLLVLRHAKSSWQDASLPDFDRPLTKQGKQTAQAMGKEMRRRDLVPDLVLSSAARRARQTAKRALKAMRYDGKSRKQQNLYLSGVRRHLNLLRQVDEAYNRVLLVGHNPTLEQLVERLTAQQVTLRTGTLVCLDLETDAWTKISEASGRLRFAVKPEEVRQNEVPSRL
ncbi:2,3-bisphosphoglycerate-dependent phosphoglycerate mutase [Candidatus Entotheonellaceae bacterium PAL068K]